MTPDAVSLCTIDYRCEDRKTVAELIGEVGAISLVLTPSFRKPRS